MTRSPVLLLVALPVACGGDDRESAVPTETGAADAPLLASAATSSDVAPPVAAASAGSHLRDPAGRFDWGVDARGAWMQGNRERVRLDLAGVGRERVGLPGAIGELTTDNAEDPEVHRVDRVRAGMVEHWQSTAGGLRQSWDLTERPAGEGPVRLVLTVSGARVVQRGAELRLLGEGGGRWRYADLRASDARGRPLRAHMRAESGRIALSIDDGGATWPIHVDPVSTTADRDWDGSGGESLGEAATVGDFNGDGIDDLALGAPDASGGGAVYIYYGSASLPAATPDRTLSAPPGGASFGAALDAGDIDGDGVDDLVVGAPDSAISASGDGAAWVFHGSSAGLSDTATTRLTGSATASAYFGCAVAFGDVNGDGYADVVVGEYGYSSETGQAWIYAGSASGADTATYRTLTGSKSGMRFGWSVSSGGSGNGDSYDEVVVGAPYYTSGSQTKAGRAVLYAGASAFFTSTPSGTNYTGSSAGYNFGSAVLIEGSYNGDSAADLVIGAPGAPTTGVGRIYYYQSSSGSIPTSNTRTFDGSTASSDFGGRLAAIGDTDDDGYEELLVGGRDYDSGAGMAWLYDGGGTGVSSSTVVKKFTGSGSDALGSALAGGDLNGDGNTDVVMGSPGANSGDGYAELHLGGTDADGDGYVVNGGGLNEDCDDSDASVHPGATEVCDDADVDEDCDGVADESGASGESTWYLDADGDGYGDPSSTKSACNLPTGYTDNDDDCDDDDALINPSATEVCDDSNTDEDCDGLVNDDDPSVTGQGTVYLDADGDGYGGSTTSSSCDIPAGYTGANDDCDDSDASINPGATEVCDASGTDENCNGLANDADPTVDPSTQSTYYADNDHDGYGGGTSAQYCDAPISWVTNDDDCDDNNGSAYPGASEVCDSSDTDEDCDGLADDDDPSVDISTYATFYLDNDGDGYGGSSTVSACDQPNGTTTSADDCDDSDASIHPGATEVCDDDDTDEDCDGLADDDDPSTDVSTKSTWYADNDGDGYGGGTSASFCDQPAGYVATSDDCNDNDSAIHPGASEVCDSADTDEDCNGLADDDDPGVDASTFATFYVDGDGDGYGGTSTTAACDLPGGATIDSTDCDDTDATVYPGATEICDEDDTDENCNGLADDDDPSTLATTKDTYYADADGDGYGAGGGVEYCEAPSGYVPDDGDCNDADASIHPGATEVCDSGNTDEDCNGLADDNDPGVDPSGMSTWYSDDDGDGYGGGSTVSACDLPSGYLATAGDCDDSENAVHPGATELPADGVDQDCDGTELCYADADGDGYAADDGSTVESADLLCTGWGESDGSVGGDCDDNDDEVYPGATDTVGDGIDSDCDGVEVCYVDADGDGYRDDVGTTVEGTTLDCSGPGEASVGTPAGDCDDTNATYNPGATEDDCADPEDYNCDGSTGYADADGDGWAACEDCDDDDASVHPGATEEPGDGVDQDCDGVEICYIDADGDGEHGASTVDSTNIGCTGAGEADASSEIDCDDTDANINHRATEAPGDGVDQDCDGAEVCYVDADGDGYRDDSGATVESTDIDCTGPGEATDSTPQGDCDDNDPAYNPGAAEEDCTDPNDYNCDGAVGYSDGDGDGFAACEECDDSNADVNPDAIEVCNGIDDDCDGDIDGDAVDATDWYADSDGDGFTTTRLVVSSCDEPDGFSAESAEEDCDDYDATTFPGATEIAGDGIDQDCDGFDLAGGDTGDTGAVVWVDTGIPEGDTSVLPGDTAVIQPDTGGGPVDTAIPWVDTGRRDPGGGTIDTAIPWVDTGRGPIDTGIPRVDTGGGTVDTGGGTVDTGSGTVDTGSGTVDTGSGTVDTGDTDSHDTDSGDTDSGETDSGDTDSGDTHSGTTETGDTDSGGSDSGDSDTGDGGDSGSDTGDSDGDNGPPADSGDSGEPPKVGNCGCAATTPASALLSLLAPLLLAIRRSRVGVDYRPLTAPLRR